MLVVEWAVEHGTEVAWGRVAVSQKVVMDGLERVEWDEGALWTGYDVGCDAQGLQALWEEWLALWQCQ
jgi:hypothetical protein